jgi:hypothetical protein
MQSIYCKWPHSVADAATSLSVQRKLALQSKFEDLADFLK